MSDTPLPAGCLLIVATPIGNLGDMTPRAIQALRQADAIAAEDTRHSAALTRHFGIHTPLLALHEHNETQKVDSLLQRMHEGERIALISDAGMPLISDPGYLLVRAAQLAGLPVRVFPGACAAVAALAVAGLASDRFAFEGFLPARATARMARLGELAGETRSLIFYESSHRIVESLTHMAQVLGAEREASVARELTKLHEESHLAPLGEMRAWLEARPQRRRGEFVVVVAGAPEQAAAERLGVELDELLAELLQLMPVAAATRSAVRLTGVARNRAYERALAIQAARRDQSQ